MPPAAERRSTLVIVRTHLMTAALTTMLARLRGAVDYDILVLCDERRGRIDVPDGFAKASLTPRDFAGEGLRTTPDAMWRCGDYTAIVGADLRPDADFVWLIEPDVWLNFEDWSAFFAIFDARSDIDFIARGNIPAGPAWRWTHSMTPFVERAFFCLFSIVRLSRRAIAHVRQERRRVARLFTAAAFPDLRDRPGFDLDDLWPNDEVFVASVLRQGGFVVADFNDFGAPLADDRSFGRRPHSVAALGCRPADNLIYHPAVTGDAFGSRLRHLCRDLRGEGRSVAAVIDWVGPCTFAALDRECGVAAQPALLQWLRDDAATPLPQPRRGASLGRWPGSFSRMLRSLGIIASALALAACSVVGVHDAAEPKYTVVAHLGPVEIRQYGKRIAAETVVKGDEQATRSDGFRRIADYIFGANHDSAKIAMTAPVAQARDAPGQWRIGFFMPADRTLATLPAPNDAAITLVPVPADTLAVLRFSGTPSPEQVASHTSELVAALEGSAWRPTGAPVAWFYDPPWTLPPTRRNEVAVPVSPL